MGKLIVTAAGLLATNLLAAGVPALAAPPSGTLTVPVQRLAAPPKVDGDTADWGKAAWTRVPVRPADDKVASVAVGAIEMEIAAGIAAGRFYLAARWPDAAADTVYRPWQWMESRYRKGEERDDMLAVRFHLDGQYDRCMISDLTYSVDVWLWAAGRTDPSGVADDLTHTFTTALTDEAAEYKTPSGQTVYMKKPRDEGRQGWANVRAPKEMTRPTLPSVEVTADPAGSVADVLAKGAWSKGRWTVEFSRALDTGHADDVVFAPGRKLPGQIAVFNKSHSENKSVSAVLEFQFPPGN